MVAQPRASGSEFFPSSLLALIVLLFAFEVWAVLAPTRAHRRGHAFRGSGIENARHASAVGSLRILSRSGS